MYLDWTESEAKLSPEILLPRWRESAMAVIPLCGLRRFLMTEALSIDIHEAD